mmetsp:Transcript_8094/g.20170  ORF Transcript_8094/g.20170 Transcript_8094/m.20170 type:complete len:198 (-) Transcript_8094:264-857(-)
MTSTMSPSASASVFIATSADGFIAKSDGAVDWLNEQNATVPEGEDLGFAAFMASVGALIMGRKTFETVRGFVVEGTQPWPYGDTPVIVLSSKPAEVDVPASLAKKVRVMSGTPAEVLASVATDTGAKDAYVDGGTTIRAFLAAGLVGRVIITTVPVTLGSGIPLFDSEEQRAMLEQDGPAKKFENGFVQTTYRVRQA